MRTQDSSLFTIAILCLTAPAGQAVTIDLDALTATAVTPVEVLLPEGNHTVTPISETYTAWHPWGGDSQTVDCDANGENCYQGWLSNYSIAVPSDEGFRLSEVFTPTFETQSQALQASRPMLIYSDGVNPISFYVPDSFYEDNAGGMSLSIEAAPSGETELEAILPQDTVDGRFVFEFTPELALLPLVWFDPEISVGYDYALTGANFGSITAPDFTTIPDADGYSVSYGATTAALLPGETQVLPDGIEFIALRDIDPLLALNPEDEMAFPIGFSFTNVGVENLTIFQTPITEDTGPSAVPLPASFWLMGLGVFGLMATGRRKNKKS